jgi:hypothetical protein
MQFNTFIKGLSGLGKEPMKLSFKSKETYEREKVVINQHHMTV